MIVQIQELMMSYMKKDILALPAVTSQPLS